MRLPSANCFKCGRDVSARGHARPENRGSMHRHDAAERDELQQFRDPRAICESWANARPKEETLDRARPQLAQGPLCLCRFMGVCFRDDCDEDIEDEVIGIMGNSLGGTVAIYANSLIDGVDFAIAGSCVSSIDESIMDIYHCADLYIPQLRKFFEFGEIAGLAAPKPLIVVQGGNDPIFPIKGMRIAVDRINEIYTQFGAGSCFIVKVADGGHQFYQGLATDALAELRERI